MPNVTKVGGVACRPTTERPLRSSSQASLSGRSRRALIVLGVGALFYASGAQSERLFSTRQEVCRPFMAVLGESADPVTQLRFQCEAGELPNAPNTQQ